MKKALNVFLVAALAFWGISLMPSIAVAAEMQLIGQGDDYLGNHFVVAAVQTSDGEVHGTYVTPRNFVGMVVEVVPPGTKDYWCVRALLDDNSSRFLFAKDENPDRVYSDQSPSNVDMSCSEWDVPDFAFHSLSRGDFKTSQ